MYHINSKSLLGPKCKSSPRESLFLGWGQTMDSLHQEPSPRLAANTFLPWPPQTTDVLTTHLDTHSPCFSELRHLPLLLAQQSTFFNHENTYLSVAHMPEGGGEFLIKCWLVFPSWSLLLLSHTYFLPLPLSQVCHSSWTENQKIKTHFWQALLLGSHQESHSGRDFSHIS